MNGLITKRRVLLGLEIAFNFVLPFATYRLAKPHLGEVHAIMAAAVPPIIWSLVEFARHRRVDGLSLKGLGGIGLSLVGFAIGGSAKLLLLRESLVTGLIGLVFLASALIGRPLIYVLAKAAAGRRSEEEQAELEAIKDDPTFRHGMAVMTVVWGLGLVAETATRSALVFHLPTGRVLLISPFVGYGTFGLLILWTMFYARILERREEAAESGS